MCEFSQHPDKNMQLAAGKYSFLATLAIQNIALKVALVAPWRQKYCTTYCEWGGADSTNERAGRGGALPVEFKFGDVGVFTWGYLLEGED